MSLTQNRMQQERNESVKERRIALCKSNRQQSAFEGVPLVEFMDLTFTRMPGEGYCRNSGLCWCILFFRVLINFLVHLLLFLVYFSKCVFIIG